MHTCIKKKKKGLFAHMDYLCSHYETQTFPP